MRQFRVYISHGCPGDEVIVEMPDDATTEDIERECKNAWDVLMSNVDTGWYELDDDQMVGR